MSPKLYMKSLIHRLLLMNPAVYHYIRDDNEKWNPEYDRIS